MRVEKNKKKEQTTRPTPSRYLLPSLLRHTIRNCMSQRFLCSFVYFTISKQKKQSLKQKNAAPFGAAFDIVTSLRQHAGWP